MGDGGDAPSYDHAGNASWSCFACEWYLSAGVSACACGLRKLEDLYMVGGADVGGNAFFLQERERMRSKERGEGVCASYPRLAPFSSLIAARRGLSGVIRDLSAAYLGLSEGCQHENGVQVVLCL